MNCPPGRASTNWTKLLFRDFLKKRYDSAFPETHAEQLRLLQNLNLAAGDEKLNLAGVLLFAEEPELVFPQFVAKGVRFPGIAVHADRYDDTEDFEGPLGRLFKDALAFVMRNLHKVQGGNGVNAPARRKSRNGSLRNCWSMPSCTGIILSARPSAFSSLMIGWKSSAPARSRTI